MLCLDDAGPAVAGSDDTSIETVPNRDEARSKSPGMNN